uniref:Uncharacterized protein n=1 Tax=Ciona savignyi TaxID=51511 RepID=H2ZPG2_CIOSA
MKYDSRHAEFRQIRSSFLSFLKQNDLSPNDATTSFVCYEEPQYPLSQAYLEQMREIHHRNKAVHFRKEITKLWGESNLSAKETETFRAKYLEFPSKIEESLVNRLDKYSSELKVIVRGQLLKRMESALANIKSLRSQAYMLDDDSMLGFDLYENGTNEQLRSHTENFEKEAENIKRGMVQRARITKPLHDWDNSFEKLIELHQKSQDPERLKNRGGQLLRDERARKALKHQLVKQEKQILEISETNKGNDRFIINGKNLEEYFAAKWEDLDRIHSSFINNRKMKRK